MPNAWDTASARLFGEAGASADRDDRKRLLFGSAGAARLVGRLLDAGVAGANLEDDGGDSELLASGFGR